MHSFFDYYETFSEYYYTTWKCEVKNPRPRFNLSNQPSN